MSNKNNNNNNSTEKKVARFENLLRNGKKEEERKFLKNHMDVEARNKRGMTLLMDVVLYLDADSVEIVLDEDPNLDAKDHYGDTALDYALIISKKDTIELLKKHGAKTGKSSNNKNNTRRRLLNNFFPSLRKINLGNTRKVRKH